MPDAHQSPHVILSSSPAEILDKAKRLLKNTAHLSAGSAHLRSEKKLLGLRPEGIDMIWESGMFQWILVEADGAARRPLKAPAPHEPVIPKSSGWIIGLVGLDVVGKPLTEKWVFRPERYADISGTAPGKPVTEASLARAILHPNGIFGTWESPIAKHLLFLNKADCQKTADIGQKICQLLGAYGKTRICRAIIGKLLQDSPVVAYDDLCQLPEKESH
jgi:probable selenium-dependent hydroxylase accessory protein YqeC